MTPGEFRSGVVAILGRPNAGKSTLLNRMLGEKLAIVSPKPQTTRSRILGVADRADAQILLLDTPGVHASSKPLNRALTEAVSQALEDCDVGLILVDPAEGWGAVHEELRARLEKRGIPVVVVATKCDRVGTSARAWPLGSSAAALRVSGLTGAGVDELLDTLAALLPAGPRYYAEDQLTDRPLRFLAAERVREVAFEELEQELPYSLAVAVESFDESRPSLVTIRAALLVERDSQKAIVIGRGGGMIKRIGSEARRRIEPLVERRVHLELWVRVEPHWPRRLKRLKSLGYY